MGKTQNKLPPIQTSTSDSDMSLNEPGDLANTPIDVTARYEYPFPQDGSQGSNSPPSRNSVSPPGVLPITIASTVPMAVSHPMPRVTHPKYSPATAAPPPPTLRQRKAELGMSNNSR